MGKNSKMGNQIYFKIAGKKKNGSKGRTARHIFGREPSKDYFIKILFLLSKWFQTKRFLWEFPIGSYVKLSSAVAAIGRCSEMPDTIMEENHSRIISAKFG